MMPGHTHTPTLTHACECEGACALHALETPFQIPWAGECILSPYPKMAAWGLVFIE